MFVGFPLCRNKEYVTNMGRFAMDVIFSCTLLSFVPRILKPIAGPLITIPNCYHYKKTAKYTIPLIKERFANIERKHTDPMFNWTAPNDYITWHINLAYAEDNLIELAPEMIAGRLLLVNVPAIHTTVLTITHTLFDLISSDPKKGYIEGIMEEVTRVYTECNGVWTKAALAKMTRTDSAIRESMRVSNVMTRGMLRKVMSPDGIENKVEGWSAPQHAFIGLDIHSVHHDPEIYSNPDEYDAFRFSRPWEEYENLGPEAKSSADFLKLRNTGLTSTSDTFLPFGHGRHAWYVKIQLRFLLPQSRLIIFNLVPVASLFLTS
jgi:cytochrome P450